MFLKDFFKGVEEFIDYLDEIFPDENEKKTCDDVKKNEKGEEDFSSYTRSKKDVYVNGEKVSHDEDVWKNGKHIKNEHYRKDCSVCGGENVKPIGSCEINGKCQKPNDSVEYQIEFEDNDELNNVKKKNESLRKCVNQLSADAESSNKKIAKLEEENANLRQLLNKMSEGLKGVTGLVDSLNK